MKWFIAFAGGIIGGCLGFWACRWGTGFGIYALVVPGWLLGYGVSFARICSAPLSIAAGVAATAAGLVTDWMLFPFKADRSLGFYLAHLADVNPVSLALIAVGGIMAFWVNFRRRET